MTTHQLVIDAPRRKFSVEEYHRLMEAGILNEEDRVELIFGEIIEMSPIGPKHAGNLDRIGKFLTLLVRDDAIIRIQSPVGLGNHSEPEPDITVLRPREDFYTAQHPRSGDVLLIVELSDTSLKFDMEAKLPLYASFGIPEIWLVDLKNNQVMVHRNPEGEKYLDMTVFRKGEVIPVGMLPEAVPVEKVLL